MATTLHDVSAYLDGLGLRHEVRDEHILIPFATEHYRDLDGEASLLIAIRIEEEGRYFKLFAPNAFRATGPYADAFLRAAAIVQWRTKLVQFEFDEADGEVRPIVEFPLEDAPLTAAQLSRCVRGLVQLLEVYAEPLRTALDTGDVVFADETGPMAEALGEMLSRLPPEVLSEALRVADERQRNGI
jgi:hypothetical protein